MIKRIVRQAVLPVVLLAVTALGGCVYPSYPGYYGYYPGVYAPPVGVVIGGGGYYHRGYYR